MPKPSTLSDDVGARIAGRMATGEPLISICRDDDMPALMTAMSWLNDPGDRRFGVLVRHAFEQRLTGGRTDVVR